MKYKNDLQRVFISFASADRDAVAAPIARALKRRGYSVWYDEISLAAGDSLRAGLDEGLRQCDFGIAILSENYFDATWTKDELAGLISREKAARQKILIPIWHNVTHSQVSDFSPIMSDRVALSTGDGTRKLVRGILQAMDGESKHDNIEVTSFISPFGGRLEIRCIANSADSFDKSELAFSAEKIDEVNDLFEKFASTTTLKKSGKKSIK